MEKLICWFLAKQTISCISMLHMQLTVGEKHMGWPGCITPHIIITFHGYEANITTQDHRLVTVSQGKL